MTYRTLQLPWGQWPIVHYSYPKVIDLSYTIAILRSLTYRTLYLSLGHRPVMHYDEPEVKPLCQVHQMVCLLSENTKACLKINTNIFILRPDYASSQRKHCTRETNANFPSRGKNCLNNSEGCMNVHTVLRMPTPSPTPWLTNSILEGTSH